MQFKNRIIVLLCILFCTSHTIQAQNIITGKVVDAESRQPVESASITDANLQTVKTGTDKYGDFSIKGGGQLIISSVGYKTATITVTANVTNFITLEPEAVSLKAIVLESNAASKFSTLSKIDLSLKPVKNTQELLRIVPGLFIAQHAGGGAAHGFLHGQGGVAGDIAGAGLVWGGGGRACGGA